MGKVAAAQPMGRSPAGAPAHGCRQHRKVVPMSLALRPAGRPAPRLGVELLEGRFLLSAGGQGEVAPLPAPDQANNPAALPLRPGGQEAAQRLNDLKALPAGTPGVV